MQVASFFGSRRRQLVRPLACKEGGISVGFPVPFTFSMDIRAFAPSEKLRSFAHFYSIAYESRISLPSTRRVSSVGSTFFYPFRSPILGRHSFWDSLRSSNCRPRVVPDSSCGCPQSMPPRLRSSRIFFSSSPVPGRESCFPPIFFRLIPKRLIPVSFLLSHPLSFPPSVIHEQTG